MVDGNTRKAIVLVWLTRVHEWVQINEEQKTREYSLAIFVVTHPLGSGASRVSILVKRAGRAGMDRRRRVDNSCNSYVLYR